MTKTNNYPVSSHGFHELALRYSEIPCVYSYSAFLQEILYEASGDLTAK